MDSFKDIIQKFDQVLQQYNRANYDKLQSPLSEKEINYYLGEFDVKNEELKMLFEWKNGYDIIQETVLCQIVKFDTFLSMDCIQKFRISNEEDFRWEDQLFIPLISDSTGQFILFNNRKGNEYGQLFLYSTSLLFDEPISYYDSIKSMIQASIEAYETGMLKYDAQEDWLKIDTKGYRKIAMKHNPRSKYWYLP